MRSEHDPPEKTGLRRFFPRRPAALPDAAGLIRRARQPESGEADNSQAIVAVTADHRKVKNWGLVLQAAGVDHLIQRVPAGWRMVVAASSLARARDELRSFEQENLDWPPPPREHVSFVTGNREHPPTVFLIGLLAVFYSVTGPSSSHDTWFAHGAVVRSLILEKNQWWRTVTALSLHADPVHLFGNMLIGGVLVHLVCRQIGAGFGWLGVLAGGALGNWLNVVLRSAEHQSVGFSTAVFAAVGILCGLKTLRLADWKDILAPLGAGAALLAMLGTSGERTDIGAHVAGLACGLVYGAVLARLPVAARLSSSRFMPYVPFGLLFLVVWCWRLALAG